MQVMLPQLAEMDAAMSAAPQGSQGPVRPIATRPLTPPGGSGVPTEASRHYPTIMSQPFPGYPMGHTGDPSQPHIGKAEHLDLRCKLQSPGRCRLGISDWFMKIRGAQQGLECLPRPFKSMLHGLLPVG